MQRIDKSIDILHTPLPKLFELCEGDFELFTNTISLAINLGIRIGQTQVIESYNEMFHNYNEVSIRN